MTEVSKGAATLEPEPTQHNSLDRLQTRKCKSNTSLFIFSGYTETDPTEMLSPPIVWRQQSESVSSRQSGQTPAAVRVGFECCCSGQNIYLIELVRNMTPLWDQIDKNYHNRDLKPKLWDEIGGKLNVAGTY